MSTFYAYRLTCRCGEEQTVELVYGIHISRLPWARQQILDGTFQRFVCPECGAATVVTSPIVYTDFERDQYVVVEPNLKRDWAAVRAEHDRIFEDSFAAGPSIASEMGVRFRKRMVIGLAALREKLVIWDAGLDDLVVEAVKGYLAFGLGLAPDEAVFRLGGVVPGGHLSFLRFDPIEAAEPPVNGAAVQRGPTSGLIDAELVLATSYRERLERRAEITTDFPWLADEWMVDFHDGLWVGTTAGAWF